MYGNKNTYMSMGGPEIVFYEIFIECRNKISDIANPFNYILELFVLRLRLIYANLLKSLNLFFYSDR